METYRVTWDPRVRRIPNRFREIFAVCLRQRANEICECRWNDNSPSDFRVIDGQLQKDCELCGRPWEPLVSNIGHSVVTEAEELYSQELEAAGRFPRGWRNDPIVFFTHDLAGAIPPQQAAWQLVKLDPVVRTIEPILSPGTPEISFAEIMQNIRGDKYNAIKKPKKYEDWFVISDDKLLADLAKLYGHADAGDLAEMIDEFEGILKHPDLHGSYTQFYMTIIWLIEAARNVIDPNWGVPTDQE